MNTTEESITNENQPIPRKILKATHSKTYLERQEQIRNIPSKIHQDGRIFINHQNLDVVRVLGEGAFGEVVLVVDKIDPTFMAAVKRIGMLGLDDNAKRQVKKEALIQRAVNSHPNVLKFLTMRAENNLFELFLEYADGGELFDQIEPDVGMEVEKVQWYFKQLLNGLQYIHAHGISHRDIKPENLLLDKNHILKISDFGMATIFRHGTDERILTTRCGTLPYAAPEVIRGSYKGEAIDIWSAGVVLITMLVGELPWEAPAMDCEQYVSFVKREGDMDRRPWCRMDTTELSLIRLVLCEDPFKRGTISRIKKHPWLTSELNDEKVRERRKTLCTGIPIQKTPSMKSLKSEGLYALSQPTILPSIKSVRDKECVTLLNIQNPNQSISHFSQPIHYDLLSQPTTASQMRYINTPASLVRRMTRFFVIVTVREALLNIEKVATNFSFEFKSVTNQQVFITHKMKDDLSMLVTVYEMIEDNTRKVLVDFRRSKGDGLEFKRIFIEFKNALSKIICPHSHGWLEKHGLVCFKKAKEVIKEAPPLPIIEEEETSNDMDTTND